MSDQQRRAMTLMSGADSLIWARCSPELRRCACPGLGVFAERIRCRPLSSWWRECGGLSRTRKS